VIPCPTTPPEDKQAHEGRQQRNQQGTQVNQLSAEAAPTLLRESDGEGRAQAQSDHFECVRTDLQQPPKNDLKFFRSNKGAGRLQREYLACPTDE
jgi:chromosome condensin MukBEF ATPase and DNA-binding subunit MukB